MRENNIGIITEQNDLGLGFDLLSEEDQKIVQENNETGKKKERTE